MPGNIRLSTYLFIGIGGCLCFIFYTSLPPPHSNSLSSIQTRSCDCSSATKLIDSNLSDNGKHSSPSRQHGVVKNNLAILVPFRDRFEELLEFVPNISSFLNAQKVSFHIFIINQIDNLRFNRAALLNAGYLESFDKYDYIALHDVDLIPLNPSLKYLFPLEGPYHVAAPHLHPRYHYPTFIGGILLIRRDHFRKVNGMSNKYWGWGLEDDEFYARLKEADLQIHRPGNLSTGIKDTFRHFHNRRIRKRDMIKCYNQQEITRRRDRQTGLSTTKYTLVNTKEMVIDGYSMTLLNIELSCDHSITPWCNCTQNVGNTRKPSQYYQDKVDIIVPRVNKKKHLTIDG